MSEMKDPSPESVRIADIKQLLFRQIHSDLPLSAKLRVLDQSFDEALAPYREALEVADHALDCADQHIEYRTPNTKAIVQNASTKIKTLSKLSGEQEGEGE